MTRTHRHRICACALLTAALAATGCLKKLDESLLDRTDAGTDAGGADGGGGTGGTGGTGAAGGTGATGGDAGTIVPYDPAKFPVTKITTTTAPVLLATDDTDVYHSVDNMIDAPLDHTPISGGAPTTLVTVERPHALSSPSTSSFVFVTGGQNNGDGGTLIRTAKVGGAVEPITISSASMGPGAGLYAATDGFAYVTFKADAALHTPALARFGLGAGVTTASVLYTALGDESGGPVVATGNCVYWVSNGDVYTIPTGGAADRAEALATPVTDALGLTADAVNIYYTRADGSVWARKLSLACDGTGAPEALLAQGFVGIGDLIRFRSAPTIAWVANGNDQANYAGGGIFMMPVSGGQVTQIAPADSGPQAIADAPFDVIFAVTTGEIRKIPKP
jgi:hypothetical protein